MNSRQIKTVQDLADYMVRVDANRAKVKAARAAGERISEGVAPEYLPALIGFVYNEFLEVYLQTLPGDDREAGEYMDALPEELILESLFGLFLNNFDKKDVRELFAQFGPIPPRPEGERREADLLELYLSRHMPPKAQFARRVADYNKTVPREQRLGSRSTSEVNMLKYVDRMLCRHHEDVERWKETLPIGYRAPVADRERPISAPDIWGRRALRQRQFRRKMSRQT
jgi:hypothetical protein